MSVGPTDALWLSGVAFLIIIVLAGTLVRLTEQSTRLERVLVAFGCGLFYLAVFVAGGFAVGLGLTVMVRVWRVA